MLIYPPPHSSPSFLHLVILYLFILSLSHLTLPFNVFYLWNEEAGMLGNWSHGSVATISLCYRYKKRRLALCSVAPQKCLRAVLLNGKQNEKERGRGRFTPHIDICLVPRLYPDTINPAFHLCLALKMSAPSTLREECSFPCETLVNAMCKLRYQARVTTGFFLFFRTQRTYSLLSKSSSCFFFLPFTSVVLVTSLRDGWI